MDDREDQPAERPAESEGLMRNLLMACALGLLLAAPAFSATQSQAPALRAAPPSWVGTASVTIDGVKYLTPDDVRAGNITAEAQAKVGEVNISWPSKGKTVHVHAVQGGGEKPHEFKARVKQLVADQEDLFPPDPEPPKPSGQ
ncbi:MAG TPA: hypothetical protein VMT18_02760 [Planctomycetota bacterium]|nr:hypothetical protein [Planctomycetota bacterium]